MNLKEKLELLNAKSCLKDIQDYVEEMQKDRGFYERTNGREMLLLMEEVGELAKAIRKESKGKLDINKKYDTNISEELADVFIYLLSIASINNIDLFEAFKEKERKNCNRVWK